MASIVFITTFFFMAFIAACISYFFDKTFEEGMIFERWRPSLAKLLLGKKVNEIGIQKGTPAYIDALKDKASEGTFFYKPLGGCIVCFSIWLSVPVYLVCIEFFEQWALSWWHIPLWFAYATVSNFMVRKMIGD